MASHHLAADIELGPDIQVHPWLRIAGGAFLFRPNLGHRDVTSGLRELVVAVERFVDGTCGSCHDFQKKGV